MTQDPDPITRCQETWQYSQEQSSFGPRLPFKCQRMSRDKLDPGIMF